MATALARLLFLLRKNLGGWLLFTLVWLLGYFFPCLMVSDVLSLVA